MITKIYHFIKSKLNDNDNITVSYIRKFKKFPNKKNPRTFAEKIHCIKISNWLEDKQCYVDKYRVRDYIKNTIGDKYLIRLIGIWDNTEDICFEKLPNSFVLKLNNGSGYNMIVKDKLKLNFKKTKDILNEWLSSDFYQLNREKQYKGIKQYILCEEYINDDSGELRDYKFFCFDGKVKFIQVDNNRFSNHIQNFYDINWNKLDFTYVCEKSNLLDKKPNKLEEMIFICEKLSSKFPFVRVDLYYAENKIYFGELTFTPNNGMESIYPLEKDLEIASWIDLNKYIN